MKCIIIDDDLKACKALERLIDRLPTLKVLAVCDNPFSAVEPIARFQPDLLFLNVEMHEDAGLKWMETLAVLPEVIITTGKTPFDLGSFNYPVADYLKKPVDFPRFRSAVEKAQARRSRQLKAAQEEKESAGKPDVFSSAPGSNGIFLNAFFIRTEGRYVRLLVSEVLYFENIGDYVRVCTKTGNMTIYSTMKGLNEKLNHPQFVKVHRSYIVNISKIVDIEENSLVIERKVIPISRAHKAGLMARLNVL